MIEGFTVRGFRCLKSVKVPMRPLTVLIGPNDSGKSSFLRALEWFATPPGRYTSLDFWRVDPSTTIEMRANTPSGKISRTIKAVNNDWGSIGTSAEGEGFLAKELLPVARFELPVGGVSMESNGFSDGQEDLQPGADGSRVAALLDYYLRKDRKRLFSIVEAAQNLVPGLEDLLIATPSAQARRIDLRLEHGVEIPAANASAGVRLLLFFLALAYHPSPPRLILLEEPENGIHPKRLKDVMTLLREITAGKHGKWPAQVVLTTHSPFLLDHVNLETDQVLVFQREEDGSRAAKPVDAERLKVFLDEFMLGEVWFNEEEKGLVAKES